MFSRFYSVEAKISLGEPCFFVPAFSLSLCRLHPPANRLTFGKAGVRHLHRNDAEGARKVDWPKEALSGQQQPLRSRNHKVDPGQCQRQRPVGVAVFTHSVTGGLIPLVVSSQEGKPQRVARAGGSCRRPLNISAQVAWLSQQVGMSFQRVVSSYRLYTRVYTGGLSFPYTRLLLHKRSFRIARWVEPTRG